MKKKLLAVTMAAVLGITGFAPVSNVQAKEVLQEEQKAEAVRAADGSFETAQEWDGEAREVTVEEGEEACFKFVPQQDGIYEFYSTGNSDSYGQLYSADGKLLSENDDGGEDENFCIRWILSANNTYYVKGYGYSHDAASFTVNAAQRQLNGLEVFYTTSNPTVTYGEAAVLEVYAVSDQGEISYQWYESDCPEEDCIIEGATQSSYVLPADNRQRNYSCQVTDGTTTLEVNFYLDIDTGLKVSSAIRNEDGDAVSDVTAEYGKTTTLGVTASGGLGNLSYQWYKSDYADEEYIIEGAVSSSYEVTGDADGAGYYYCEVSDGVMRKGVDFYVRLDTGLEVSSALKDEEGDAITSVTVEYGKETTLKVTASGGLGNLSYQWYQSSYADEEHIIEGADQSSYKVSGDADFGRSRYYYCEVSDGVMRTGVEFYVRLDTGLEVSSALRDEDGDAVSDVTVEYEKTTTLGVTASGGVGELSYQWYKSDYADEEYIIEGATSSSYEVTGDAGSEGYYYCEVSDGVIQTGVEFYVRLDTGLEVSSALRDEDGDPIWSVTVKYEETTTLKVAASGGVGELSYQWYKSLYADEDCLIEGATSNSYEVTGDADSEGYYYCEVSDGVIRKGVDFSVIVDTGLRVWSTTGVDAEGEEGSSNYRYVRVKNGEEMTLEVEVSGGASDDLSYQWYWSEYEDGEDDELDGATDSSYEISGEEGCVGFYHCTVSDGVTRKSVWFEVSLDHDEVSLDDCTISIAKKAYYTGSQVKPKVTVKYEGNVLEENEDYTVSYMRNVNIGKAAAIISGKGDYTGEVTKNFTIVVKKGKICTVKGYKYKFTGKNQVAFAGVKKKLSKVKIPKTVKIGGKNFKVTSIANNALKKCKATSIDVGDNVKVIGKSAFEGCGKLTKVTLGKGVTNMGPNAFKNCKKLGTITVKSTKMKTVGKNALKGTKANAKIKVPGSKLKAYKKMFRKKGQGKKVKITR